MTRSSLLVLCALTSVIQSRAFSLADAKPPKPQQRRTATNTTRTSYKLVACYESLGAERPLRESYWTSSISECMNWAAGFTFFGFGCPVGSSFECRRGNHVNAPSAILGCEECGGQATVVHHCNGTAVIKYNGVDWLMGGWHRDPVYMQAPPGTQRLQYCSALTPAATPSPQPPEPIVARAKEDASAVGDPHLQNVNGERFDLMRPGKHVLLNIPRGQNVENALLRVEADARQMGGQCADMYFQELNITGAWAEAKQMGGFRFRAEGARQEKPAWEQFGKVALKVVHGVTQQGIRYLNFRVKNLGRAGFAVGGLLGEDDHSAAATPSEACGRRMSLLQTAALSGPRAPDLSVAEASFHDDI